MARKLNSEKLQSQDRPGEIEVKTVHGMFAEHPLLSTLQLADVLPWRAIQSRENDPFATERAEIVRALGEWMYEVSSKPKAQADTDLATLRKLIGHVKNGQVVEKTRNRVRAAHTTLVNESKVAPSRKEWVQEVRGDEDRDEPKINVKTIDREIKLSRLPYMDEKDKVRIRSVTNALSRNGSVRVDPQVLRRRMIKRNGKAMEGLPPTGHELIALCACCRGKLVKGQVVRAFYEIVRAESGHVTDTAFHGAMPRWMLTDYSLEDPTALRAYLETLGLSLVEEKKK